MTSKATAAARTEVRGDPSRRGQRVLVVDDEDYIRHFLGSALRFAGFVVETCDDGRTALAAIEPFRPDLVLLDVLMPDVDGFETCRRMRAAGIDTPVVFLTARDSSDDKVNGFLGGGDDYVTKPFDLDELVVRLDAILKRTARAAPNPRRHEYAGIVLDEDANRVEYDGEPLALSPTEFRLLRFLMVNAERVVSKSQLLAHVWGCDSEGDYGVIETYVFYLRRKLGAGSRLIRTVRGAGYVLRAEP
jgi:two-component system OmpR family response regulator